MNLFRRKQGNRRLGRMHVLDVKLRSDQVRKTRLRVAALATAALGGTALVVCGLWLGGAWSLNRFVYQNQAFAIRTIEVQTDGVISPDQLRRWANVRSGQNLLALDLARVKRDLQMSPALATVTVERILPKTLRIRVTEREPLLQVSVPKVNAQGGLDATIFHLDENGVVMLPLDPRQRTKPFLQPDETLPLLSGLNFTDLKPGQPLNSPAAQAALKLAGEFAYSPMAGLVDLKRIDVSAPDVIVVTTGQGSEVTFGLENIDQQMRRWRQIYDLGQRTHRNVASIDLAVSNNVPVRWLEAKVIPPPAKLPKTTRSKKRNV
ncbi:MAG: FtsQ-type POTRA domain-containing protein [Verrucomicrobiota bacterium]